MKEKIRLSSGIGVGGRDCHRKNLAELVTELNAWNKAAYTEQRLCTQGCVTTGSGALLLSSLLVQLQVTLVGHILMTYGVEDYFCP